MILISAYTLHTTGTTEAIAFLEDMVDKLVDIITTCGDYNPR